MTFRELRDKYRAGQASEEERALVEAELEKSEAIADYLAEQVEDALGAAETQAPAGEVRHIQKKVNRRLRRTAVWAACIVLAALLGVRFVVSPLVSSLYYQPNEKGFGTGIEGEPDPGSHRPEQPDRPGGHREQRHRPAGGLWPLHPHL